MVGDNVYGDVRNGQPIYDDVELVELRRSYAQLAASAEFQAVRRALPVLAVWDDHDYGINDGGRNFLSKEFAERVHERFWGAGAGDAAARPGVHHAHVFGPEGRRVQLILLDTRFFRSALTRTDEYGKKGKERYVPAAAGSPQDMLGEAQWAWLAAELAKPADLRLVISSIQVTPTVHGWEAWSRLPDEQRRLYDLLKSAGVAEETVFVSGDRHAAFLYANTAAGTARPIPEITSSSLNKPFGRSEIPEEVDPQQVGDGFSFANYGAIGIDWEARRVRLAIHDETGAVRREMTSEF
jgi:alkaline phosphatase D